MKLLVVHNAYRHRGGEDVCVDNEVSVLTRAGVDLKPLILRTPSGPEALWRSLQARWGGGWNEKVEAALREFRPDVLHTHNLFPALSPRIFDYAKRLGVRIVHTLHNFRPLCLNGLFMTPDFEVCERCAKGDYRPGIQRGCYRTSRLQSAGLASHLRRARESAWYEHVDTFIAPSRFLKDRYGTYGFDWQRIQVDPHVLPQLTERYEEAPKPYLLYLGRLSEEKGLRWLLETFSRPRGKLTLWIAGEGPLKSLVQSKEGESIRYLGRVEGLLKEDLIRQASALVMPSDCYENLPLAVLEANVSGTPALLAGHGGLLELADGGFNLSYKPRDVDSFWDILGLLHKKNLVPGFRRDLQAQSQEKYGLEGFVKRRLTLYEGLVQKRPMKAIV